MPLAMGGFLLSAVLAASPAVSRSLKVVVAGCIVDEQMRVLVAQRPPGKSFAGMWEFPGGKLEPNETAEVGLVRELREELGIEIRARDLRPLAFSTVGELVMLLFACRSWKGELHGLEGQEVRWVVCSELRDGTLTMPPADLPLIEPVAKFVAEEFSPRWDRY
jgi:8-oxo-dGTP diphosphatase